MQPATADSVSGDFDDRRLRFHGIETRLYRDGNDFRVATVGGDGKPGDFRIAYTFGHYPLQQYLVDAGKGRLQALNVAWDSRPANQGGQRWFHLQVDEDINSEHPFFWTRHLQNANSRCIECHATDVKKNFDATSNRYDTRWTETGVGCESCHGPAGRHLEMARNGELQADDSGFVHQQNSSLRWAFADDKTIASPSGERSNRYIDTCGGCHSRRSTSGDVEALAPYHDHYRLALIEPGLYFSDGQIDDEVFVLGSFLQSKMQQQGVTCGNCHDPHSGKTLMDGNGLCAQCHLPEAYDVTAHHRHKSGSSGSICVDCHMPERIYMTVDPRRDHSFPIPSPARSLQSDTPNACNLCHREQTPGWAAEAMTNWGIGARADRWASINRGLALQDAVVFREYARDPPSGLPTLRDASLLGKTAAFPSRLAFERASAQLSSREPLLRRAAVGVLQSAPPELRWQLLNPMIEDPLQTIRHEVAIALSDLLGRLNDKDAERLQGLINEFRESLEYHADSPAGLLAIGNLEVRMGFPILAERAFKRALEIEPDFVPALINLADLYRAIGSDGESKALLQHALEVAPDSANPNHAYGLYLVRAGQPEKALKYLQAAAQQQDASPRHVYVYAVALDSRGQTAAAMKLIEAESRRWPNNLELYFLQVAYMDKTGNTEGIHKYLSMLATIAANNPKVRNWMTKYGNKP